MSKLVTIVDYGIGNLLSVKRGVESCGARAQLTDKPRDILNATCLILPGVGAFSNGMRGLSERELIDPLKEYAASGRPMLGICLGMQMLFTESVEFGEHQGLGIIDGRILPIRPLDADGRPLKVPHIGWSGLECPSACAGWEGTILDDLINGEQCYFVHSFTAVPDHEESRLADTLYGSSRISAVVRKGRIYGCQFHPEKSGVTGLKILRGFLES